VECGGVFDGGVCSEGWGDAVCSPLLRMPSTDDGRLVLAAATAVAPQRGRCLRFYWLIVRISICCVIGFTSRVAKKFTMS
jgi:hypothetical protein